MGILTERDGVEYALLEPKDLDEIADVLTHGFTDGSEPTAVALGLTPEDVRPWIECLLPKMLGEGLSIVARYVQTGEVAGVQVNEEMSFDWPAELTRFEWAVPVFALANEMYGRYFQEGLPGPNELAHLFMIVVSKSYRGKGIGGQLLALSLEQARERGYRRAVVEASGLISQHILRKAGFTDRVEIPYATFEHQGKVPFQNTGDHPSIILMDKYL